MIPDDRTEIPSPEVTHYCPHLKPVKGKIPEIDPDADILLLLGRDILCVHKIRNSLMVSITSHMLSAQPWLGDRGRRMSRGGAKDS